MSTWFGRPVRMSSLSRATRGSSGKGKPLLASFVQGSPVAACYRPPASATGPRLSWFVTSASEATSSFGGDFLPCFITRSESICQRMYDLQGLSGEPLLTQSETALQGYPLQGRLLNPKWIYRLFATSSTVTGLRNGIAARSSLPTISTGCFASASRKARNSLRPEFWSARKRLAKLPS